MTALDRAFVHERARAKAIIQSLSGERLRVLMAWKAAFPLLSFDMPYEGVGLDDSTFSWFFFLRARFGKHEANVRGYLYEPPARAQVADLMELAEAYAHPA